MYGTAKALTFVSQCVDVVRLETPVGEEAYRIRSRPCEEQCWEQVDCPDWIRALQSIGDWAATATPLECSELDDGTEEFTLARLVLRSPGATDPPEVHDHWQWEFSDIETGKAKAVAYIEQGLIMGEKVIVMAGPLCIDMLQEVLPKSNDIFYFNAEVLLHLAERTGEDFNEAVFSKIAGTVMVREMVAQGYAVRLYTGHLPLLLGKGEVLAALRIEDYLNKLINELGILCACAIPSSTPNLDVAYRRLCRAHTRVSTVL